MPTKELKDCYFCECSIMHLRHVGSMRQAHCQGCGAAGPLFTFDESAISAWNRRAPAAPMGDEVAKLIERKPGPIRGIYWHYDTWMEEAATMLTTLSAEVARLREARDDARDSILKMLNTPTAPAGEDCDAACRTGFEQYIGTGASIKNKDGSYMIGHVQQDWEVWQVAWHHLTTGKQGEVAVPEYVSGKWTKVSSIDQMQAFYLSRLPAIREAAKAHGYAIAVHGSQRRDFDLMAMQWADGCSDADTLAKAIQEAACGISASSITWEKKPLGRIATSLCICWTDHSEQFNNMLSVGHIDLSIITPPSAEGSAKVPEGWQLVPIEPTDAMLNAWFFAPRVGANFVPMYKAMIAAAPANSDAEGEV